MNKNRPVNLDISTIKLPVTAYASILHRVSGVILLGVVLLLMAMLNMSLASEESFEMLKSMLAKPWAKIMFWGALSALVYHLCAGVRHLIMDMGVGESLEGGKTGAKAMFVISIVLIVILGVWIW